jgi:hypothetical protein
MSNAMSDSFIQWLIVASDACNSNIFILPLTRISEFGVGYVRELLPYSQALEIAFSADSLPSRE